MKTKVHQPAVTIISLSVNGHPVSFTFVGRPTVAYMEQARKAAENAESTTQREVVVSIPPMRLPEFKKGQRVLTLKHGWGLVEDCTNSIVRVLLDFDLRRGVYAAQTLAAK